MMRLRNSFGIFIAVVLPFEAMFLWMLFSEAADDNLPVEAASIFARTILAVAPFGLTPFIVPVLLGTLYGLATRGNSPSPMALIIGGSTAVIGWGLCAAAAEFYRQFITMDGGREPTVVMWIANLAAICGLAWLIRAAWRHPS